MTTDPKPEEISQFMREYDEGKHPLSAEGLAALEKVKPGLFKRLSEIDDRLDLQVDEFKRIKALTDNSEIHGLCDRAVTRIIQHTPVIVQRDEALAQLARRDARIKELEAQIKHACEDWAEDDTAIRDLCRPAVKNALTKIAAQHLRAYAEQIAIQNDARKGGLMMAQLIASEVIRREATKYAVIGDPNPGPPPEMALSGLSYLVTSAILAEADKLEYLPAKHDTDRDARIKQLWVECQELKDALKADSVLHAQLTARFEHQLSQRDAEIEKLRAALDGCVHFLTSWMPVNPLNDWLSERDRVVANAQALHRTKEDKP